MRDMLEDRMMGALKSNPRVAAELSGIEDAVRLGALLAALAVDRIVSLVGISESAL